MTFVRRLRWDDWNGKHIARHQVTPEEVEEVCHAETVQLQGKKGRVILIGPTQASRVLAVVLEHEGSDVYYPVTARPASRPERRYYQERKGGVQP